MATRRAVVNGCWSAREGAAATAGATARGLGCVSTATGGGTDASGCGVLKIAGEGGRSSNSRLPNVSLRLVAVASMRARGWGIGARPAATRVDGASAAAAVVDFDSATGSLSGTAAGIGRTVAFDCARCDAGPADSRAISDGFVPPPPCIRVGAEFTAAALMGGDGGGNGAECANGGLCGATLVAGRFTYQMTKAPCNSTRTIKSQTIEASIPGGRGIPAMRLVPARGSASGRAIGMSGLARTAGETTHGGSGCVVSNEAADERMPENLPAQLRQYRALSLLAVWHAPQNFVIRLLRSTWRVSPLYERRPRDDDRQ